MGFPIASRLGRFSQAWKSSAAVPDGKPARTPAGGPRPPEARKPGTEAPEHLHDSQPAEKSKMSMMDKLSAVGNIVGAGASIFPLFQSHQDQKADSTTPPGVEDKTEYNQGKLMAAMGPLPVNW